MTALDGLRERLTRMRAELGALCSEVDALLLRLDPVAAEIVQPDERYLHVAAFATRRRVSLGTVRRWILSGLPTFRSGRVVRIVMPDADRWLDAHADLLGQAGRRSGRRAAA